jgi:NADH dehydrogenase [ubiquinone] 1 alpha subcomplex assembly factor 7
MSETLFNPLVGYYMKENVLGREGDFVTSPEISPFFGEVNFGKNRLVYFSSFLSY